MLNKKIIGSKMKNGAILLAICLMAGVVFTGCGDKEETTETTSSSSTVQSSSESKSSSSSKSESKPKEKESVVGTWKLAAMESEGVTMGGNLSQILESEENPSLVINEDGTGTMTMNSDTFSFTWNENGDEGIALNAEGAINDETGNQTSLKLEDGAVFMKFVQDEKEAYMIFTEDGTYDKAKVITMEGAEAITSQDDLLGRWTMSGMNMMGVSAYGDAEALSNMNGGLETFVDFKEDGTVEMNGQQGTWQVSGDGATMTSEDITGVHTYPIKKTADGIVMDSSESFGGMEFIILFIKQ